MNPAGALDLLLAACRDRIARVGPIEAYWIQAAGGLLVDIRPAEQRVQFGEVPGALVIERNVLEWRLDPLGPHRHPEAGPPGRPVVVFCQEGFASILAVDSLRQLGVPEVSELAGGYEAWRSAGLPVTSAGRSAGGTAGES